MCIRDRHYKDIYDLVEQIENELFQEFESILMSYTIDDISPVSYTHLDVYKRQVGKRFFKKSAFFICKNGAISGF